MRNNKKLGLKIEYIQIKPKNETEAKEAKRRLDRAFDILFDEVDKKHPLSKGSGRDQ